MPCACDDRSGVPGLDELPPLERLSYFHGQCLTGDDLRVEQRYFVDLLRLQARWLSGFGVACGLEVSVGERPRTECTTPDDPLDRLVVHLTAGVGVDAGGRLLVVRHTETMALADLADADLLARIRAGNPVWLWIRFIEQPTSPSRPNVAEPCVPLDCTQPGRQRAEVCVQLRGERPPRPRCERCGEGAEDDALLLARLSWDPERGTVDVDNGVRRLLTRHALTTITGIGWVHGATYAIADIDQVLANGFPVRFSRPVDVESVTFPGAVEVLVWQGGRGRSGEAYALPGEVVPVAPWADPDGRMLTREIRFVLTNRERLEYGDRVLFRLRGDVVLDLCCRAVDGEHIGGRVPPFTPHPDGPPWEAVAPVDDPTPVWCRSRPGHPGAWTSGNGVEGGTFESWYQVEREPDRGHGHGYGPGREYAGGDE